MDRKRLSRILGELRKMSGELQVVTGKDGQVSDAELKALLGQLDAFEQFKLQIVRQLLPIADSISRLHELELQLTTNDSAENKAVIIKLRTQNRNTLQHLKAEWLKLKSIYQQGIKDKTWDAKVAEIRGQQLTLLAEEIQTKTMQNAHIKSNNDTTTKSQITIEIDEHKKRTKERRLQRRASSDHMDHKHSVELELTGFKVTEVCDSSTKVHDSVLGGEEQVFMQVSAQRTEEENAMLEEIRKGVEELGQIAKDMNVQLRIGQELENELDNKLDRTSNKFKKANTAATELIKETNTCSWIPLCICFLILFILIIYIAHSIQ